MLLSVVPSFTLKVKDAVPLTLAAGVVAVSTCINISDGDGAVGSSLIDDRIGQTCCCPLRFADSVPVAGVSSSVVNDPPLATGVSFTAFTVMVMVAVLLSNKPSLALKVNVAVPLKLAFGT